MMQYKNFVALLLLKHRLPKYHIAVSAYSGEQIRHCWYEVTDNEEAEISKTEKQRNRKLQTFSATVVAIEIV